MVKKKGKTEKTRNKTRWQEFADEALKYDLIGLQCFIGFGMTFLGVLLLVFGLHAIDLSRNETFIINTFNERFASEGLDTVSFVEVTIGGERQDLGEVYMDGFTKVIYSINYLIFGSMIFGHALGRIGNRKRR